MCMSSQKKATESLQILITKAEHYYTYMKMVRCGKAMMQESTYKQHIFTARALFLLLQLTTSLTISTHNHNTGSRKANTGYTRNISSVLTNYTFWSIWGMPCMPTHICICKCM